MKILVCGSRTWHGLDIIEDALRPYTGGQPNVTIIHGGAPGADSIAGHVAYLMGYHIQVYRANWRQYGRAAGYMRNKQMLMEGKPDLVLAFWDGKSAGTKMMIELAKKAGVEVKIFLQQRLPPSEVR